MQNASHVEVFRDNYGIYLQVHRGAVVLEQVPLVRYLLEQISYFCKKPPKGFEKYFEQGKKSTPAAGESAAAGKKGASETTPSKSASPPPQQQQQKSDWNFGMFANSNKQQQSGGNRGGQGRPIGEGGEGNRERFVIIGAVGAVALLGLFAFFEMGYKEISWKEFVTK